MDNKTKSAIVGGTIFGGLMSSTIGIVIAIASGQTVDPAIGMIISFATGGAVTISILNIRKLNK
jgi:hypothetical protein